MLAEKSIKAVRWNYIGTLVRMVVQFSTQIAFARILGPEIIGIFGYVLILSGLVGFIVEQGLGWAIVNAKDVTEDQIATANSRIILASLIASILVYFSSTEISTILGEPRAKGAIEWFSPAFLLYGLTIVVQAQLKKGLKFKEIQIASNVSYFVAYPVVGASCAYFGMGVGALIIAWQLQAALYCILMQRAIGTRMRFRSPLKSLSFTSFGIDITAINLTNWATENVIGIATGRLFGAEALGRLNVANNLARTPANQLVQNLQSVLFPTAALTQDDPHRLKKLYITALGTVLFFAAPLFVGMAICSREIIEILLSTSWGNAADLLLPLSLAMIPHVITCVTGSTLSGCGKTRLELKTQFISLFFALLCILMVPPKTSTQLAWYLLGFFVLRATLLLRAISICLSIERTRIFKELRGPIAVSVISSTIFFAIEVITDVRDLIAKVSIVVLTILTVQVLLILFVPNISLSPGVREVVRRVFPGRLRE